MSRNIAVIGVGRWGKNLVRTFNSLKVLHTVCDSNPRQLAELELDDAVRRESDLDAVLRDPEITGVAIATPAATHYDCARAALAAGKDVFVEKPLALTPAEGHGLVELAESEGRILMVGHILRYHPAVLKLGEMIRDGELGRLEYIYSNRLNLGRLRTEENILWSFAPHDVSVILGFVDEQPVAVSAQGEAFLQRNISDVTLTAIEFPNGTKAHTFVSWLHPFKEQRLVVVGSEQMAVFEDSRPDEKLVSYPHRVEWHAGKIPVAVKGERRVVPIPDGEPLQLECEHFLESMATRIPPRTDGYEGLRVLTVLAAAEQSLRQNGRVVPIVSEGNGHRHARATSRVLAAVAAGGAEVLGRESAPTEAPAPDITPSISSRPLAARPGPMAAKRPEPATDVYVHPTAVVDSGAVLGPGSKVWHFSHISAGCRIGRNNIIGQNVFVADAVTTGANCKIQNNVSLYKGVRLEDDVFCGPSCVFTNVVDPRAFLEKKTEFRETLVRRGASIGANATIVCGHTLGRYCLIGSGAVVTRDVPDYALMTGVPARQRGWVCRCGMRLRLESNKTSCPKCGEAYELAGGRLRSAKESL
uniref:Oxidoreductase n=1 Tax=candidate division WOR-3 bacterium TaxID=2052148 RepID=A0A7C4CB35_UNCW3